MKKIYKVISLTFLFVNIALCQTQSKQPTFTSYNTGQVFTSITVDQNNNVWAGTDRMGAFFLDNSISGSSFNQLSIGVANFELSKLRIQSIAADKLGNVWVAHAGSSGVFNGGGVERIDINSQTVQHFTPDRNAKGLPFLERDGTATLNAQQVAVAPDNSVWIAQRYHDLTVSGMDPIIDPLTGNVTTFPGAYIVTPGTFSFRKVGQEKFTSVSTWKDRNFNPPLPYPAYTYNPPVNKTAGTRTFNAISADSTSVWASVYPYQSCTDYKDTEGEYYPSRLLQCDTNGNIVKTFTKTEAGFPALGGVFTAVYANNNKGIWVASSLIDEGFSVYNNGQWYHFNSTNFSKIIPAGTRFNLRAIWGNEDGDVFMGTTNGLIVYDSHGKFDQESSYTLYNQAIHGLISNNILGGVSENRIKTDTAEIERLDKTDQWIVTDNGIIRANIGFVPSTFISPLANRGGTPTDGIPELKKNSDIQRVLDEFANRNSVTDPTYHIYNLETEICDMKVKYGIPCTQEQVYKYMVKNVKYQAVNPYVFNKDVINPGFMGSLNDNDFKLINDIVNEQKDSIQYATTIFNIAAARGNLKFTSDALRRYLPPNFILGRVGETINTLFARSTDEIYKIQIGANPKTCISNTAYKLYNAPNYFLGRKVLIETVNFDHYAPVPLPFPPVIFPLLPPVVKVKVSKPCNSGDFLTSYEYDPITIWVDDKNYAITNYTNRGHFLYPGLVERKIMVKNGKVVVVTKGEGYHFCNTPNNDFVSSQISKTSKGLNLIVGTIMFKNVDINLKNAFTKEK